MKTPQILVSRLIVGLAIVLFAARAGWGADELVPVAVPAAKGDSKIDTILTTLNQTLAENKNLQSEIETLKTQLGSATVENNVLRSQLRTIQSQIDGEKNKNAAQIESVLKEMSELKKANAALMENQKRLERYRKRSAGKIKKTGAENERLKQLLNSSILESERDDYLHLIRRTDASAKNAASEMQKAKAETEKLRMEAAALHYNLGNLLFKGNEHKKAVAQFKQAIELNPNDAWAHYNLATIYDYYMNDEKESLVHYRKYLKLEPIQEEADKIRERVLEIELKKEVTPPYPLKKDFEDYHKRLNKSYAV